MAKSDSFHHSANHRPQQVDFVHHIMASLCISRSSDCLGLARIESDQSQTCSYNDILYGESVTAFLWLCMHEGGRVGPRSSPPRLPRRLEYIQLMVEMQACGASV
jgi:hypothetical protein